MANNKKIMYMYKDKKHQRVLFLYNALISILQPLPCLHRFKYIALKSCLSVILYKERVMFVKFAGSFSEKQNECFAYL